MVLRNWFPPAADFVPMPGMSAADSRQPSAAVRRARLRRAVGNAARFDEDVPEPPEPSVAVVTTGELAHGFVSDAARLALITPPQIQQPEHAQRFDDDRAPDWVGDGGRHLAPISEQFGSVIGDRPNTLEYRVRVYLKQRLTDVHGEVR